MTIGAAAKSQKPKPLSLSILIVRFFKVSGEVP